MNSIIILLEGFALSIGLIVAIGPQNAYVLRQGIRGRHAIPVASVCFVVDAILISLGVLGVGRYISSNPTLATILGWGGVAFLAWFAARSIRSAINARGLDAEQMEEAAGAAKGAGVKTAMLHAAAFSLLNPWAYLDTMVLIGGVSVRYGSDAERLAFLLGAIVASCVWFYGLAIGGRRMAPMFQKAVTWRILDGFIAAVMVIVAVKLIGFQLNT